MWLGTLSSTLPTRLGDFFLVNGHVIRKWTRHSSAKYLEPKLLLSINMTNLKNASKLLEMD